MVLTESRCNFLRASWHGNKTSCHFVDLLGASRLGEDRAITEAFRQAILVISNREREGCALLDERGRHPADWTSLTIGIDKRSVEPTVADQPARVLSRRDWPLDLRPCVFQRCNNIHTSQGVVLDHQDTPPFEVTQINSTGFQLICLGLRRP